MGQHLTRRLLMLLILLGPPLLAPGCRLGESRAVDGGGEAAKAQAPPAGEGWLTEQRHEMVRTQIEARGVRDVAVLNAMRTVPRHRFVPERMVPMAYRDHPLPIGERQTISQPYIVALMTELLEVRPGDRVLEVGTGSGYQAAVLAEMGVEVYTIEIIESLGRRAREVLEALGYEKVHVRIGDGYEGWPEAAPFDGVIVTAAPDHVPQPLVDQLAAGGRMVIPVGTDQQLLTVLTRTGEGVIRESSIPVRFVPMTGEARGDEPPGDGPE